MVLVDKVIESLVADLSLIEPYTKINQQPASYDLTIANIKDENDRDVLTINPGETVLIGTAEHINMPENICGFIKDKSTYLRSRCNVGQGFVDPGFKGKLTVSFTNNSTRAIAFHPGMPFCQLVFMFTQDSAETTYNGHYQDSNGIQGPAVTEVS